MTRSITFLSLLIPVLAHAGAPYPMPESLKEVFERDLQSVAAPNAMPTYPVSLAGPNRIAVTGERIINTVYDQSQLEIELDDTTGDVFVIPKGEASAALFVTTDSKNTYALTLLPRVIPSQNVELTPKATKRTASHLTDAPIFKANDMDEAIKNLVGALARGELPYGFEAVTHTKPANSSGLQVLRTVTGAGLVGEVLRFQHQGNTPLELTEKLFMAQDVLAVAIQKRKLSVGDVTLIYRILHARSR